MGLRRVLRRALRSCAWCLCVRFLLSLPLQVSQHLANVPPLTLKDDDWPVVLEVRVRHRRVGEATHVFLEPLDVRWCHPRNLRTQHQPEDVAHEDLRKLQSVDRSCEIDERISHIAVVVSVHRKVEEVVSGFETHVVDLPQQAGLSVLVGDISKHHGRDHAATEFCLIVHTLWHTNRVVWSEGLLRLLIERFKLIGTDSDITIWPY